MTDIIKSATVCIAALAAVLASPAAAGEPLRGSVQRDVVYGTADGAELKLDLFFPRTRAVRPWPVIVAVHGGGWSEGDKQGFDLPQARGKYLVASINYRLFPSSRFPAMIEDVKLAIRYLRAHASDYNLDPERIAILGHSAGGHLAALAALTGPEAGWDTGEHPEESSAVKTVVILSGPSDLFRTFGDQWADGLRYTVFGEEQWEAASPVCRVHAGAPPFLIVHGDADTVVEVEHGRVLHDALLAAGTPSELVILRGAAHGFESTGGPPVLRPLRAFFTMTRLGRKVMVFLKRQL